MKSLITLLFAVFFLGTITAQNTINTQVKTDRLSTLDEKFSDYTIFSMDTRQLNDLRKSTSQTFSANISLSKNQSWDLVLIPNDLRAASYQAIVYTDKGEQTWDYEVHTYKGYANQNTENEVRLTIKDDHVSGYISEGDDLYYIEPVRQIVKSSNSNDFVIYLTSDMTQTTNITCQADHLQEGVEIVENDATLKSGGAAGCYTLELAIEADYEYYQIHGDESNNIIMGIMNEVEGVYSTDFGLDIDITYQGLYTTENDPYSDSITTSGYIISEFRNYWNSNKQDVHRDLAHLFTGRSMNGVSVGVAFTNATCSSVSFAYGVSQNIASFANSRFVLTAHEIGHNLNAQHSHGESCSGGGSIMCSGVQPGAFYFSEAAKTAISAKLNAITDCLGGSKPGGLTADTGCSTVNLTWEGSADADYAVRVRPTGTVAWTNYDSPTNTLQIDNLEAQEYEFQVRKGCNATEDGFSEAVSFTMSQSIALQLNVFLEGAYDESTDRMRTNVNNLKLLPGQADNPTAGQPYSAAPWYYYGIEGLDWTAADYQAIEAQYGGTKVVDWILVSFRTSILPEDEMLRAAALLLEDGTVVFPEDDIFSAYNLTSVYVVIEHRNHMGIMSPEPLNVDDNCTLAYDFTTDDSYIDAEGIGFGQTKRQTRWAMFCGDGNQAGDNMSYDITGSDKSIWVAENGFSRAYSNSDYNMDGDITGADKALWVRNNGKSSRVLKSY